MRRRLLSLAVGGAGHTPPDGAYASVPAAAPSWDRVYCYCIEYSVLLAR